VICNDCEYELKYNDELWRIIDETNLNEAVSNIIKVFQILKEMFNKQRQVEEQNVFVRDIQL